MSPWERGSEMVQSVPAALSATIALGAGFLFLFFGWQVYRVAWVALGVLVGGAIGAGISFALDAGLGVYIPALVLAIPIGLILGMLTLKLQKVGAFIVGGLAGAVPVLSQPHLIQSEYGLYATAGFVFLLGGVLAVLLWRPMIILSFSVLGASLIAHGAFFASDCVEGVDLRGRAAAHPVVTACAVGVLSFLGIFFQVKEEVQEKDEKKE